MGATWSQLFPGSPQFTEKNLPNLRGRVFLITGGASGVGRELASILYKAGGKVYIAGRSKENAEEAIKSIKSSSTNSGAVGQLEYLFLDLQDLATVKPAVETFTSREAHLDVLWNNAGVSLPPLGSISKQGHELQLATNCLGPYLLTQLLLPTLEATTKDRERGAVRVIWTSTLMVDMTAPKGGTTIGDINPTPKDQTKNYTSSKMGNWYLASELARANGSAGIISVTQNPGQLRTNLLRHAGSFMRIASSPLMHDARFGAYTELWASLSPDLTETQNGGYIIPWGRTHPSPRADLLEALRSKEEGGTGHAQDFRAWCEKKVAAYR